MCGKNFLFAPTLLASLVALLLGLPAAPQAQCVCGYGDGLFTTHSGVVIDGAFADWAAVLADLDNNTCDGGAQPDLDAPVQSTGRDLEQFAYTWDSTHVQAYTGRAASAKNTQRFIYYADLDNDGFMETGERVIVATWKGSNRSVSLYLGRYLASVAGGDPMLDPFGSADGYSLPGTITNLPSQGNPDYSGTWGQNSGLAMEWQVPWADTPGAPGLGIASGSAFTFHVSSTNSQPGSGSFPAQIDDNMAGCGGGGASTQWAGVTLDPNRTLNGTGGDVLCAAHTVTNDGNGTDRFDLSVAISGSHTPTLSYYRDVDLNGVLSGPDTLLTDTDSSGTVDTDSLASGSSTQILVCYTTAALDAGTATVTVTATSAYDPGVDDDTVDTVVLAPPAPNLVATKVVYTVSDPVQGEVPTAKAIPGGIVAYTIAVENQGGGSADSVQVTDAIPDDAKLYVRDLGLPGSGPVAFSPGTSGLGFSYGGLGDGGDSVEFSNNNGGNFLYSPSDDGNGFDPTVTHIRIRPAGILSGSTGTPPGFSVLFRAGVR